MSLVHFAGLSVVELILLRNEFVRSLLPVNVWFVYLTLAFGKTAFLEIVSHL